MTSPPQPTKRDRRNKERTFKVRHERLGTRVERVDDHLAVGRTCDLYAILQLLSPPVRSRSGTAERVRRDKTTHRRSSRPGAGGAQTHAGESRTSLVSGRKERGLP